MKGAKDDKGYTDPDDLIEELDKWYQENAHFIEGYNQVV